MTERSPRMGIGSLPRGEEFVWKGYHLAVKRQTRRGTLARLIKGDLAGCEVLLKKETPLRRIPSGDGGTR